MCDVSCSNADYDCSLISFFLHPVADSALHRHDASNLHNALVCAYAFSHLCTKVRMIGA